ncbi:MFS transporter [Xenorhabdus innexi]|uniref:MFS transporter n=1 Tax=Xenorhabdus innexi TaxID=290109 RepID=A0A1N6MS14_9GAMM|nr:MFS transporter [Xenorhabdus innexi]PHM38627.1 MFS transporter [Xenorhabdus innexi]SIP71638.1 putative drug transport transmembrane protein [Xenorhabdus innexi]
MNRNYLNVFLLFIGQGLTGSIISLLTLASPLVGKRLSPFDFLSTLPVTATVCGAALMVYFASMLMEKSGRRNAFISGNLIGLVGSGLAGGAIIFQSFILFTLGTFILGGATVFNQYYRFAAAEVFEDESSRKKAISFIIGGGIVGGISGPYLASKGADLLPDYPFAGAFLLSAIICILTLITQLFISLPVIRKEKFLSALKEADKDNSFANQLKSKLFVLSTVSCAVGFSVMTLLMNATPLAMSHQQFSIEENALVLQWHFFAMYAPALLLPFLVDRFKTTSLITSGAIFFIIGMAIALIWDEMLGFLFSLVFIGIGWAFMFNGGTFLLNGFIGSAFKHKLQGMNSLITYLSNMLASLSVGMVMSYQSGWYILNIVSMLIIVGFVFWFISKNNNIS